MSDETIIFSQILQSLSRVNLFVIFITICIWYYKKAWVIEEYKIIGYYLISILIIDALILYSPNILSRYYEFFENLLIKYKIENNNFLAIFHYLAEIYFFGLFFRIALKNKFIGVFFNIYFVIAIFIYFFIDDYHEFGTVNSNILKTVNVIFPLYYLTRKAKEKLNKNLLSDANILICFGILLPNIINLLFSLFAEKLQILNYPLYVKIKLGTNIFDVLGYCFFAYCFITNKKIKIN